MLSFLNGTYMVAIEFLDKNGQIITKYSKKNTENKDSKEKKDSNVEITRDIFSFIGMEILFSMNKVPRIALFSTATDEEFNSSIGSFYITVQAMSYPDENGEIPRSEQFSATFPATPVTIETTSSWMTTWFCVMDLFPNVSQKKEISFIPHDYLDRKYVYTPKKQKITKMVYEKDKWVKKEEEFEVNVLDTENLKTFNVSLSSIQKNDKVTLHDAFLDISKISFHKPSDALLGLCKSVTTNSFSNKTIIEALESLALQVPGITNGPYMQGTYFTFKKIRSLGENLIDSSLVQIIEPKGDIKNKNTNSSKEKRSVPYLDVSIDDFISYTKGPNGEFIFKDVLKGQKESLSKILIKKTLAKNCITFEYSSESPSKLTIGDPVIVFASFSGAKMYGGFVTEEKLIFDHKIHGDYKISVNPETIQKQTVEVYDAINALDQVKTLNGTIKDMMGTIGIQQSIV